MRKFRSITLQSSPIHIANIVGTGVILALLYFGREVLIPITLAVILSLLIAPLVRTLRRYGLGHTGSIIVAVGMLMAGVAAGGLVIGLQVFRMGAGLPQYEQTIRGKIVTLDRLTLGRLDALTGQAGKVMSELAEQEQAQPDEVGPPKPDTLSPRLLPVEIHSPPPRPITLVTHMLSSVGGPLATMGIVFVVLIFVLLEHEALRDRLISLIGKSDLRGTTVAVNDAGERLSRFFMSQLGVNMAVGALIWLCLTVIGVPQSFLWGVLAAILRFVPYVGVWIAAFCATLLAAAIVPGWSLAILTLLLFFVVELVVAQLVEPQLYGHTTGLSPLSVVIAAIFWSWIWGPVGLVLSTPLTLCLVVAGRYIPALNFLEVLLGEVPPLTLPENFYQRSLSGDAQEVIDSARRFLKRKSPAAYCDTVLLPAMHLGRADFAAKAITREEQVKLGGTISAVIQALTENRKWWKPYKHVSVIEGVTLGRQLRNERERVSELGPRHTGPSTGRVVLGVGLGMVTDEVATEILVRLLELEGMQCRHLSIEEVETMTQPEVDLADVAIICFVSMNAEVDRKRLDQLADRLHHRMPNARIWPVFLHNPFAALQPDKSPVVGADETVFSYEEAIQKCVDVLKGAPPLVLA